MDNEEKQQRRRKYHESTAVHVDRDALIGRPAYIYTYLRAPSRVP